MNESAPQSDRRALHQELLDAGKPELAEMALRLDASAAATDGDVPPMPPGLEDRIRGRYGKPTPVRRREAAEDVPSFFGWLRDFVLSPGPAFAAVAACLVAAFLIIVPGREDDALRGSGEEWEGAAPVIFFGAEPGGVPGLDQSIVEVAADAAELTTLADAASGAYLVVTAAEVRAFDGSAAEPVVVVPYASADDLPDAIIEAEETLRAE